MFDLLRPLTYSILHPFIDTICRDEHLPPPLSEIRTLAPFTRNLTIHYTTDTRDNDDGEIEIKEIKVRVDVSAD